MEPDCRSTPPLPMPGTRHCNLRPGLLCVAISSWLLLSTFNSSRISSRILIERASDHVTLSKPCCDSLNSCRVKVRASSAASAVLTPSPVPLRPHPGTLPLQPQPPWPHIAPSCCKVSAENESRRVSFSRKPSF